MMPVTIEANGSTPAPDKPVRGADGLFHCPVAGCDAPGYKLPQHLGLHRRHRHGVQGTSKASLARQSRAERPLTTLAPSTKRAAAPITKRAWDRATPGRAPLEARLVCRTVLRNELHGDQVPVELLDSYVAWVKATETFLEALQTVL